MPHTEITVDTTFKNCGWNCPYFEIEATHLMKDAVNEIIMMRQFLNMICKEYGYEKMERLFLLFKMNNPHWSKVLDERFEREQERIIQRVREQMAREYEIYSQIKKEPIDGNILLDDSE